MRYKQTILIRKDLKMRRGKEIAQGSHASMEFLVSQLRNSDGAALVLDEATRQWIDVGMAKVCLQVHSEEELLGYHRDALELGLKSSLIRDSGRTEFHGVATYTACAIGPESAEAIDQLTGKLSLY
jgi:PTH2 family peptidyl-tRNA hydrolase